MLLALVLTLVLQSSVSPAPSLDVVLARAARYVTEFENRLARIVSEEHYVQEVKQFARGSGRLVNPMRIELRSDLALVRAGSGQGWVQYRDVFAVDGQAVRDRTDRLTALFNEHSVAADEQIRQILAASSRYNIGDVLRNINLPLLALQFLEPGKQARFRFKRTGDRQPTTVPVETAPVDGAFRVSIEMWTIEFEERDRPTIVRSPARADLPSRGRFWIDPSSGQVLMSELVVEDRSVRATIDVSYQSEPLMDMLVPVEMRERYVGRRDGSLVEGRASYGAFRRVP